VSLILKSRVKALLGAGVVMVALSGCVGTAIGVGATAGVAALDERGIEVVARDAATSAKLRAKLLDYDLETGKTLAVDVEIEVHEQRVMLTGILPDEEQRAVAVRKAWEIEEVKDVLNEIEIGDSSIKDSARDAWISTQLRSQITVDKDILAINYEIETTNAIVYLIGIAQSQAELNRVINHARNISRVRDIVSHVRIKTPGETAKQSS